MSNAIAKLRADMLRVVDFLPRGFAQPYAKSILELDEIEAGHAGPLGRDLYRLTPQHGQDND